MLDAIAVDFIDEPTLAWGYYATRMKWYRDALPHDGYYKLLDIAKVLCSLTQSATEFTFSHRAKTPGSSPQMWTNYTLRAAFLRIGYIENKDRINTYNAFEAPSVRPRLSRRRRF